MELKKIIIVGYPKSGNTWITRLTAELINCPVKGFLYGKGHPEIAIEGLSRNSDFICYKSHHQYHELSSEDRENSKIIYVIRDPRDIVLSGTSYFYNLRLLGQNRFKNKRAKQIIYLLNGIFKRTLGNRLMRKRMLNAVINGDNRVHHWCRVSWKKHLTPYFNNPTVLKITYESMLKNPYGESKKIIDFIGLKKTNEEIDLAIKKQSFDVVRNNFLNNQQLNQAKFLRNGLAQQWKNNLSKRENKLFLLNLKSDLNVLGYDSY